jgi:hypothetical protein
MDPPPSPPHAPVTASLAFGQALARFQPRAGGRALRGYRGPPCRTPRSPPSRWQRSSGRHWLRDRPHPGGGRHPPPETWDEPRTAAMSPVDFERRHQSMTGSARLHSSLPPCSRPSRRPESLGAQGDVGATGPPLTDAARDVRRAGRDEGTGSAGAEQRNRTKKEDSMPSDHIA